MLQYIKLSGLIIISIANEKLVKVKLVIYISKTKKIRL